MNREYETLGMYEHNIISYEKVKEAFDKGERVVGIVHATGTGKTYNALQLALDNRDKKIVYVVPSNGIIEHIRKILLDNPKIDIDRDFANLEFRTYQSFISLSREEIEEIDSDLLILDEFHHIGAPVWGERINMMIETHPDMKIFGMTAYTVRDRGKPYERDMAEVGREEIFSDKIVSRYDLCDAICDGVLPKPVYKSAYTNLDGTLSKLEDRVSRLGTNQHEYMEYMKILNGVKYRIHEASSIPNILKKSMKRNGKYIYFCPPFYELGTNDIETIKKQARNWFSEFQNDEDIVFYTSTSEMGDRGKLNREAFYNDVTVDGEDARNKLRVMFAINQYNEGIHAPNVDGVIMGRGTTSDIVYFEQLGRALSVRGNTKEMFSALEKYSLGELTLLCKSKGLTVNGNECREDLIQKLIAPVVIDLTNNYEFIKELENNLRNRIKEREKGRLGRESDVKIRDASFDIEIENKDLYDTLQSVSERLIMTWEEMYEFAKVYYEHNGNLEVPAHFRTNDGYTNNPEGLVGLGRWVHNQRSQVTPDSHRGMLLAKLNMRFTTQERTLISWEEMYEMAKKYYEHYGNLEVPALFRTDDGYTYNQDGKVKLGRWIYNQKTRIEADSRRGMLLSEIGMKFGHHTIKTWDEMYEVAKKYYNHNGDLEVPANFKTNDGYTYSEKGEIKLGAWIVNQRRRILPESKRGKLLLEIGMRFSIPERVRIPWEEMYEWAKKYYEHHGNLEIPSTFRTNDGYTYDGDGEIKLGTWLNNLKRYITPESPRGKLLAEIGMNFEKKERVPWEDIYEFAKGYYLEHGNLVMPKGYNVIINEIRVNLERWVFLQRKNTDPESSRGRLLTEIGVVWNIHKNRKSIKEICQSNGISYDDNKNVLMNLSLEEFSAKLLFLKENNIPLVLDGSVNEIFRMSSIDIKDRYGISLIDMINKYYQVNINSRGV